MPAAVLLEILLPGLEFWSSDNGQTYRQTDRQKARHMSPPCISTGVLKNSIGIYAILGEKIL